jgi:hypothetical protein
MSRAAWETSHVWFHTLNLSSSYIITAIKSHSYGSQILPLMLLKVNQQSLVHGAQGSAPQTVWTARDSGGLTAAFGL